MNSIYVIGSLRNPEIQRIGNLLRTLDFDVFNDWYSAGPRADDHWKEYEVSRGRTFQEALDGYACRHVFDFDCFHLNRVDATLLVLPAGKSGHLELGYSIGRGKRGFILLDDAEALDIKDQRWDCMYRFAEKVFRSEQEMLEFFKNERGDQKRRGETPLVTDAVGRPFMYSSCRDVWGEEVCTEELGTRDGLVKSLRRSDEAPVRLVSAGR